VRGLFVSHSSRDAREAWLCAGGRYKFEINSTDGNGFAKHIKQDHNLWIYLCVLPTRLRFCGVPAPCCAHLNATQHTYPLDAT
jgi:hypothetical protein